MNQGGAGIVFTTHQPFKCANKSQQSQNIKDQTMDIGWCFTPDEINWQSSTPDSLFPRLPKLLGVYARIHWYSKF